MKTMGLFGGVMIVEGLAIFMAMKFFAPEPDPTMGMDQELTQATQPALLTKELELARVRVQNRNGAKTILYSVTANIVIPSEREPKVLTFLDNHRAAINDMLSQIIRAAEEKHLNEYGLETLKRLIRFEVNKMLGDEDTIERVLISEFTPLPTGF
jgi:flagellar basal body-associated protein FliL